MCIVKPNIDEQHLNFTEISTHAIAPQSIRHDRAQGFPLLTAKKSLQSDCGGARRTHQMSILRKMVARQELSYLG
jgi:hypothetical protein